jgi:hypothetical protein
MVGVPLAGTLRRVAGGLGLVHDALGLHLVLAGTLGVESNAQVILIRDHRNYILIGA